MKISGNSLFVKALKDEGVDTLFAYPGGCVIDLFDELYTQKDINMILPRHEQAAVHAADGYARSTGKVGVCLVTSGPGATNLVTGIATANFDSVPLVCFTGQVPTRLIGNDAFQEVDIVGITRSITKHSIMVTNREDLGRIIKEAFYIANTGRKGPVLVDLPSDIMKELGDNRYPKDVNIRSYKPNNSVHVGQLKKAITMLNEAKRPVFLVGGGINIAKANEEFTKLVELTKIPVITTIMGKGAIATDHPYYIGNIGMHGAFAANRAISECDVMFSIGTRFNDRITGKLSEFASNAKIIHIDIDTASISRNIKVDIPIVADAKLAIEKILNMAKPLDTKDWFADVSKWKQDNPIIMPKSDYISPQTIIDKINENFEEAIVVTDVGQHQMWTTQFLELNANRQLLTSGGLGTMGYGFPAAIGAQLGNPDQKVICITGDGGVQMNIQELATAVEQELPVIIMIFNNSYLGMVRQWQQLFYNKRYSSTCLTMRKSCKKNCLDPSKECPPYSPDFVKLAESYGAKGIRVTSEDEILPAINEARKSEDTPVIIEFIIDSNELVLPMVRSGSAISEMILEV